MGPRAGIDGCGKSRPTWIRSPDRPTRSESLYRLTYLGARLRRSKNVKLSRLCFSIMKENYCYVSTFCKFRICLSPKRLID